VDMKSGFAFIYMEDDRDAKDAIRGLDRIDFGRKGRRLRVEWTKEDRSVRRPSNPKRSSGNSRPSKTLFVINFDPYSTRTRDLEKHFDPHGKVLNVRIRKNFAFIEFETQEDATRALEATDSSKLMDRVISVEYSVKDDEDRRNGYSPDRDRARSPGRGRDRSVSPYRRERGSPDYGRGRSRSPYKRERVSPDYGRGASPSPHRREKTNTSRSRSPRRERFSPEHDREPSPRENESPESGRASPIRERVKESPYSKHEPRDNSPKSDGAESPADERYQSRSSPERERSRS